MSQVGNLARTPGNHLFSATSTAGSFMTTVSQSYALTSHLKDGIFSTVSPSLHWGNETVVMARGMITLITITKTTPISNSVFSHEVPHPKVLNFILVLKQSCEKVLL